MISIIEIQVEQFDDEELDALLSANGLKRENFGRDMLDVLRVPCMSHLAIELRSQLAASGDITAERLAVEDGKRRIDLVKIKIGTLVAGPAIRS